MSGDEQRGRQSHAAQKILAAQRADGFWGDGFHSLAVPTRARLTTEQALRRLEVLGFTIEDAPIRRAVQAMDDCLCGRRELPGAHDNAHDWGVFSDLMLAAWVRRFTHEVESANYVARLWADILEKTFARGGYDHDAYTQVYQEVFGQKAKGPRVADFVCLYQVSLVANLLEEEAERQLFHYLLHYPKGLYYVYSSPLGEASLSLPPPVFASLKASRYLAAVGELARYRRQTGSLQFVAAWLAAHARDGRWDLGPAARDGIYLPLADPWPNREARVADCTLRVQRLLALLEA